MLCSSDGYLRVVDVSQTHIVHSIVHVGIHVFANELGRIANLLLTARKSN